MIPFILSGTGMAMFFAPVANVVLSAVRHEEEGKASGTNNAIREVGGVFGVAVLASVFASYGGYGTPQSFVDGLTPAIWVGAIVVGAGALISLLIPAGGAGRSSPSRSRRPSSRRPSRRYLFAARVRPARTPRGGRDAVHERGQVVGRERPLPRSRPR